MNKLNIGVIGAGNVIENLHLPVLANIDEINVNWIFDVNRKRADLLAETFRIPVITKTGLIDAFGNIDICLIAIPVGARKEYLELCAKNNVAVYVEKPFARSVEEHKKLSDLFEPYRTTIGYQRRFYQVTNDIRNIISSNFFGKLNKIEFIQGQYDLKSGGANRFLTNARMAGGGVIIESAIHGLDQLLYVTGAKDIQLLKIRSIVKDNIDYDNMFTSIISGANNEIKVDCVITRLKNLGSFTKYFFGNAICIHIDEPNANIIVKSIDEKRQLNLFSNLGFKNYAKDIDEAFYLIWKHFINSLIKREDACTSFRNSILTSKWIDLIYQEISNA